MADEKRANATWVISCGLFLFMILSLYLLVVSDWYWRCGAQIDPETLQPVVCKAPVAGALPSTDASRPDFDDTIEQQLWPDFGANNKLYEGLASFWGDDFISNLISATLDAATRISKPFVVNEVVPRWNDAMKPAFNRRTLFSALSLIFGAVAKEWAKDLYLFLRRSSHPPDKE